MRTRNRSLEHTDAAPGGAPAAAAGGTQQRWRDANRLLLEADSVIDRALQGDSQRFLDANTQEGGQ